MARIAYRALVHVLYLISFEIYGDSALSFDLLRPFGTTPFLGNCGSIMFAKVIQFLRIFFAIGVDICSQKLYNKCEQR